MRQLCRWDESFSTGETNEILQSLCTMHLAEVRANGPERERVAACLASRDYRSLCNVLLDYLHLQPLDAYHLRQIQAFFQKRDDLDFGVDRELAAFEKFTKVEAHCKVTNDIFRKWARGEFFFSPRVDGILHSAQRKIAEILGDVPSLSEIKMRFGPGATTQVKKRDAHPVVKLGQPLACSRDMLGILPDVLHELSGWVFRHDASPDSPPTAQVSVEIHNGVLDFVSKNFETFRTIGKEPPLNMMVQLAYGDIISERLKKFGIDIEDQSKNQRLAREGSITGALATSDQSSASDCGAYEFVWHMLPYDWASALTYSRTGTYEYKGDLIKLQKFSSMGNGFTFPLETLYFYALSAAACECVLKRRVRSNEIAVYGDDIVVPTECFDLVSEVLLCVGFLPNLKKSFASGPFRESCGTDWFSGINIRPAYLGGPFTGATLFVLHNYYVRSGQFEMAAKLLDFIHPQVRIFGPDGYGDGHLIGEWVPKPIHRQGKEWPRGSSKLPPPDWRSPRYCQGFSGYTFDTYTFKSKKRYIMLPGDCVLPSYSAYVSGNPETGPDVPRWWYKKYLREKVIPWSQGLSGTPAVSFDDRGRMATVFPGHRGYKRISIYTLTPR